jgi:hypothetical protein
VENSVDLSIGANWWPTNIDRLARLPVEHSVDLSTGANWWPTSLISPMETWVLGTAAAAIGLLLAMQYLVPRDVEPRESESHVAPAGEDPPAVEVLPGA